MLAHCNHMNRSQQRPGYIDSGEGIDLPNSRHQLVLGFILRHQLANQPKQSTSLEAGAPAVGFHTLVLCLRHSLCAVSPPYQRNVLPFVDLGQVFDEYRDQFRTSSLRSYEHLEEAEVGSVGGFRPAPQCMCRRLALALRGVVGNIVDEDRREMGNVHDLHDGLEFDGVGLSEVRVQNVDDSSEMVSTVDLKNVFVWTIDTEFRIRGGSC